MKLTVVTYSGTIEFTVDGDEPDGFKDSIKIRELKRRIFADSSNFSLTFSARYWGVSYDYIVTGEFLNGIWIGSYSVHSTYEGTNQGSIGGIFVSEKNSKLEISGNWAEGTYIFRMKVLAEAIKSEEFDVDTLE